MDTYNKPYNCFTPPRINHCRFAESESLKISQAVAAIKCAAKREVTLFRTITRRGMRHH